MDFIEASGLSFSQLNETIRHAGKECRICACQGQRFIAAGMSSKRLEIDGIPGNALGAYLGGGSITVNGNAQDAVGDTMSAAVSYTHLDVYKRQRHRRSPPSEQGWRRTPCGHTIRPSCR